MKKPKYKTLKLPKQMVDETNILASTLYSLYYNLINSGFDEDDAFVLVRDYSVNIISQSIHNIKNIEQKSKIVNDITG